jgi:hypothetical protein
LFHKHHLPKCYLKLYVWVKERYFMGYVVQAKPILKY